MYCGCWAYQQWNYTLVNAQWYSIEELNTIFSNFKHIHMLRALLMCSTNDTRWLFCGKEVSSCINGRSIVWFLRNIIHVLVVILFICWHCNIETLNHSLLHELYRISCFVSNWIYKFLHIYLMVRTKIMAIKEQRIHYPFCII